MVMQLLSLEQENTLLWIKAQPTPICLQEMQALQLPGYPRKRIDTLRKEGLLDWTYICYQGEMVAGYSVSEKGTALLEQLEQQRSQTAKDEANRKFDRRQQIFLTIISAVTGSVITLLLEHVTEIINFFQSVFG